MNEVTQAMLKLGYTRVGDRISERVSGWTRFPETYQEGDPDFIYRSMKGRILPASRRDIFYGLASVLTSKSFPDYDPLDSVTSTFQEIMAYCDFDDIDFQKAFSQATQHNKDSKS